MIDINKIKYAMENGLFRLELSGNEYIFRCDKGIYKLEEAAYCFSTDRKEYTLVVISRDWLTFKEFANDYLMEVAR